MNGLLSGRFAPLLLGVLFAFSLAGAAESIAGGARPKDYGSGPFGRGPGATSTPAKGPYSFHDETPVTHGQSVHYVEAEITLDRERTLGRLQSLPRAPQSRLDLRAEGGRVRAQWPATVVADLMEQDAEVTVLRDFMLVRNAADHSPAATTPLATTNGCSDDAFVSGENEADYYVPLYDWASSHILTVGAPPTATVTCVDVHYEILHTYVGDLLVDLCNVTLLREYSLSYLDGGVAPSLNETVTGITEFAGDPVNQRWGLWVYKSRERGSGYIDSWWIKVYYAAPPAESVPFDWNNDGIVSIVGDVPPFVDCVYFQNCPTNIDPVAVGDCSGDGIVSIIGDVPCFVDCAYFGTCPP